MTTETTGLAARPIAARRRSSFRINGYFFFILPGVAMVLAFTLFPALYGIYISLTNLHLGYVGSSFVGLDNYWRFFTWEDLGHVTRNTVELRRHASSSFRRSSGSPSPSSSISG